MNPHLFTDLAASEESSGFPDNARALRAVPAIVEALRAAVVHVGAWQSNKAHDPDVFMAAARAALAAMDATTTNGDETMKAYTVTLSDVRHTTRPEIHRVIEADCARDALREAGMPSHFTTNDGTAYTSSVAPYSVWTVSPATTEEPTE